MSIVLTADKTYDGVRRAVIQASAMTVDDAAPANLSLATLVDLSDLDGMPESVRVTSIKGNVSYGVAELYWDALAPVRFAVLSGDDVNFDYENTGPLRMPPEAYGNILISTVGFAPTSTLMFELGLLKRGA